MTEKSWCRAEVLNIWPKGQIQPVESFHPGPGLPEGLEIQGESKAGLGPAAKFPETGPQRACMFVARR